MAAQFLNAHRKVGRASRPITGRFFIPDQQRVQVIWVVSLNACGVNHPEVVACKHLCRLRG